METREPFLARDISKEPLEVGLQVDSKHLKLEVSMISAPSALFYMQQGNFHGVLYTQGSKLIKKSSRNFVTRYANLVQKSSYCIVLSVAYQNKILACSTCVKKLLKMVNDQRNGVVHVISQLNYAIFRLKEHLQRENKLILSFLYLF